MKTPENILKEYEHLRKLGEILFEQVISAMKQYANQKEAKIINDITEQHQWWLAKAEYAISRDDYEGANRAKLIAEGMNFIIELLNGNYWKYKDGKH